MRKWINGFVTGVITSTLFFSGATIFASGGIDKTIDVMVNAVNIQFDGFNVASIGEGYMLSNGEEVPYSILYNSTTYLPIRKVSELFDKEIGWDGSTSTISLGEANVIPIVESSVDPERIEVLYLESNGELYLFNETDQLYVYNTQIYSLRYSLGFSRISFVNGLLNGYYDITPNNNPNIDGTITFNDALELPNSSFENVEEYDGLNTISRWYYTFYSSSNNNQIVLEFVDNENNVVDDFLLTTINNTEYIDIGKWLIIWDILMF